MDGNMTKALWLGVTVLLFVAVVTIGITLFNGMKDIGDESGNRIGSIASSLKDDVYRPYDGKQVKGDDVLTAISTFGGQSGEVIVLVDTLGDGNAVTLNPDASSAPALGAFTQYVSDTSRTLSVEDGACVLFRDRRAVHLQFKKLQDAARRDAEKQQSAGSFPSIIRGRFHGASGVRRQPEYLRRAVLTGGSLTGMGETWMRWLGWTAMLCWFWEEVGGFFSGSIEPSMPPRQHRAHRDARCTCISRRHVESGCARIRRDGLRRAGGYHAVSLREGLAGECPARISWPCLDPLRGRDGLRGRYGRTACCHRGWAAARNAFTPEIVPKTAMYRMRSQTEMDGHRPDAPF